MTVPNYEVRDAYRKAIAKVWGLKQKDIKRDIHISANAPGQWSPSSTVEIYCEGHIPSATSTIFSFENWIKVDDVANQILQEKYPGSQKFYHEPYNNAVINVWPV